MFENLFPKMQTRSKGGARSRKYRRGGKSKTTGGKSKTTGGKSKTMGGKRKRGGNRKRRQSKRKPMRGGGWGEKNETSLF